MLEEVKDHRFGQKAEAESGQLEQNSDRVLTVVVEI